MTVNLCTVSGTLVAPDGSPMSDVHVQFLPAPVTVRGRTSQTLAPRPVAVTTDAEAGLNVGLAPGVYSVRTREPGGREYEPYLVAVPAQETADLAEIMQHLPAPQSVYDAAASARTAADAAGEAVTQAGRADAAAAAMATGARVFASRAEFQATHLPDAVESWTVLQSGRALAFRRDPAGTAIESANGVRGTPAGIAHPDHWAENTVPGTTDMTEALRMALAAAPRVQLLPVDYRVSGTIRVRARTGAVLEGEGFRSRILADSGNWNVLVFFTGETSAAGVPVACQGVQMRNLRMSNSGAQRTGGFFVTFEERCLDGRFENLWLDNCWGGLDLTAAARTHVVGVDISAGSRTATGGPAIRLSSTAAAGVYDPNDTAGGAKPSDVHFRSLNIAHRNPTLFNPFAQAVLIESADGVYFHQSHLQGATDAVVMRTVLAPNRTVIASVDFNGVYFDAVEGSHIRFEGYGNDHEFTQEGGTTPIRVKFRSITFNGCRFRAARALTGAITFSNMTEGAVERVSIRGGQIRDNRYSAIRAAASGGGGVFGLTVQGVEFSGNNSQGDALHGDIVLRDNGHAIRGNEFKPGDANTAAGYNIRLLAGPGGSVVAGNALALSAIPSVARRIEAPASTEVYGNFGVGAASAAIAEQGNNANGRWTKFADGRMICTRSVLLEGVAVTTAYLGGFRSNNLFAGAGHDYPQPFLAGTVPLVMLEARHASAGSVTLSAGAATNTRWPTTFRILLPDSAAAANVHVEMYAEGRWK